MIDRSVITRSPTLLATSYAVVGILWLLVSDVLVSVTATTGGTAIDVRVLAGWVFVVSSSVVLYGLLSDSHRELERTNDQLDRVLQQTSILQRIIRHNLRNTCNVIRGNAELLATELPTDDEGFDRVETITSQTDQLVELSEKTHLLRDVVLEDATAVRRVNLSQLVELRVEAMERQYPNATFRTDITGDIVRRTDLRLETAIDELLENAVEHDDSPEPTVEVSVRAADDGPVTIRVSDTGPGLPRIERTVFREGVETPMSHSEGVGLWVAQMILTQLGGTIEIEDNEPRGTTVRLEIP